MTAPIDKLTPAQRECLRLVYERRQIAEIATLLSVSVGAINQRLSLARQTLGVSSSIEAARILNEHESVGPGSISPPYIRNTVHPAAASPYPDPIDREQQQTQPRSFEVRETQAQYLAPRSHGWLSRPLPSFEGETNDLTVSQNLFWVLAIALGAGAGVALMITLALTIQDTISRF